jgi:hypothetical protein
MIATTQTVNVEQGKDPLAEEPVVEEARPVPKSPSRARSAAASERFAVSVAADKEPKSIVEAIQRATFPPAFIERVENFAREGGILEDEQEVEVDEEGGLQE